jgi:hypothetical protein
VLQARHCWQVQWQSDGSCHALSRGRQRVAFCPALRDSGACCQENVPATVAESGQYYKRTKVLGMSSH